MKPSRHRGSPQASTVSFHRGHSLALRGSIAATIAVLFLAIPLPAGQVRVREGTLVLLKLHYDLTTENTAKGERIEFDVAQNVILNDLVVIPKGAVAWGEVTRLHGGGKKLKGALVSFRLLAVRAVDSQEIKLRKTPEKSKKGRPEEAEIEESSPIRGLRQRMIGAEKGKEYAGYTDMEIVVNGQEAAPVAVSTPGPAQAAPPAQTADTGAAPADQSATAPLIAPNPAKLLEPQKASINFGSDPEGANIVIDGSVVGNTPSTLRVDPGRHVIEIRFSGYRAWTRTMLVGPGAHPSVRAKLEKE